MSDDELVEKSVYVATELATMLLREHGMVPPFGLTLDARGDNPQTYYPRDQRPKAEWDELLDAAADHLAQRSGSPDVGAIALVTELESGDQSGVGLQIETRASALFLVYPYSGTGRSRKLGEPGAAEGLLVGPLLAGTRAQ